MTLVGFYSGAISMDSGVLLVYILYIGHVVLGR